MTLEEEKGRCVGIGGSIDGREFDGASNANIIVFYFSVGVCLTMLKLFSSGLRLLSVPNNTVCEGETHAVMQSLHGNVQCDRLEHSYTQLETNNVVI